MFFRLLRAKRCFVFLKLVNFLQQHIKISLKECELLQHIKNFLKCPEKCPEDSWTLYFLENPSLPSSFPLILKWGRAFQNTKLRD